MQELPVQVVLVGQAEAEVQEPEEAQPYREDAATSKMGVPAEVARQAVKVEMEAAVPTVYVTQYVSKMAEHHPHYHRHL
jgi:hypothetical protein